MNLQNFNYNFQLRSPDYVSEWPMGPVPCLYLRYIWDRSQASLSGMYGTGLKIYLSWTMGLWKTSRTTFNRMKSHVWLWEAYGTGPMHASQVGMGPVPCCDWRDQWDWSHTCMSGEHGTSKNFINHLRSPIQGSESLMGPVPYMVVRLSWDQSMKFH